MGLTNCRQDSLQKTEQLSGKLLLLQPFQGEIAQLIANVLQNFQQLNPNVEIISDFIDQAVLIPNFIQKAKNGLGSSVVINLSRNILPLAKNNSIQPLPPGALDLSIYSSTHLAQVRYQDKIYGVPLGSRLELLCYNQAKLPPVDPTANNPWSQPPSQLDGLIERAKKGYSVGMVSTFEDTFWGMGLFKAQFFNANGLINPQLEGWKEWIEWLRNANTQPNFILLRNRDILHQSFTEGRLAYYVCKSDEIADLKTILKDDLRVTVLPKEGDRQATPGLYTNAMMFNHSASPREMDIAIALATFMTNVEQQTLGVIQSQSFLPSNQRVRIAKGLAPLNEVLLRQSQTAVAIPLNDFDRIASVFEQGEIIYQKALAGDISAVEAVSQLTDRVYAQLKLPSQGNPYVN